MFKKLLIGILALVGLSFSIYSMNGFVEATGRTINLDASMTGRVNMAPSGITGSHIGMQKGDKILMGVKNPAYDKPLEWQLINEETYTDYGCMENPSTDPLVNIANVCSNPEITAWLSFSEDIGQHAWGLKTSDYIISDHLQGTQWDYILMSSYLQSTIMDDLFENLQNKITESHQDNRIQEMRNLGRVRNKYNEFIPTSSDLQSLIKRDYILYDTFYWNNGYNALQKSIFMISREYDYDVAGGGRKILAKDRTYFEGYYTGVGHHDEYPDILYAASCYNQDGSFWYFQNNSGVSSSFKGYVRTATYLDMTDVVFAVSASSGSGSANMAGITQPVLPASYTNIYTDTLAYSGMKVRLQNSDMQANLIAITNKGVPIQNTTAGTEITLRVDANAGTDGGTGVNTISVIVFDENNNFKYYKPLAVTQDGEQDYVFDTTGMEPGNYKISVVNEVYDETSTSPADSSLISEPITLSVVGPLSSVQASDGEFTVGDPEVVDNGQVSTITSTDGAQPITYTLVSDDTQVGHENDYQYFEISGNQILVNKTDGLDAGDYYFKVQAIDANGDPVGGIVSNTVHIRVNKKTVSVVFDDPEQTEKTINELQNGWSETATATPSTGTKVTYSIVGGTLGLINIDPDTGAITAGSQSGYGKVIIQAIADDDPSTGKDNYEESEPATKEIIIVQEVDGVIKPDKASSDETIPTFEADEANIKTGGTIGHVVGMLGTPDNGENGTTTYTYELVHEGTHYTYFSVDPSTGEITSNANLAVGTYQFKVKVSDQWTSKEISVEVRVGYAEAEELSFYDPENTSTKITTQTATIGDTGVYVLAKGANPSNTNPITYSIKDGSSNVITVNQTSGAVTIHGVGTVTVVARKQGMSGQAEAVAELTFTVEQGEQDFIFTDKAENQLPTSGTNYLPYEEVYGKGKEFQLYTDGAVDGAQITYALKSGSPTDVITVSSSGLVHILNANLNSQIGKVIVEATSHDPSGNYADKTIELPIQINKATQSVSFKDNPIYVESGSGSVEPIIEATDTSNEDGSIPDSEYIVSVSGDEYAGIAWSNDGKTIEYDHDGNRISIPLLVSKAGNRNYEATSEVSGTLTILGPDESIFAISSPGKVTYGDVFEIRSLQDDSSSSNVQYAFEVGDTAYISNPTVTGNKASFEAIQASGNQMITIKVTRTADHEMTLTKTISIKVWPKDVEIEVEDKTKKEGEVNPALTYVDFDDQLVRNDVIAQQDIKLSTTATTNSGVGSYPITVDVAYLNQKYPNYNFTQNTGTLTITNDAIDNSWMHLETADGQRYNGVWTNQNVYLVSDSVVYQDISLNKQTWANRAEVSSEGNHTYDFWMKSTSGAITSKGVTSAIKIDKTDPVISSIRAGQSTRNAFESFMNTISFGMLYARQNVVNVQATDPILGGVNEVSGISQITYTVQKLDDALQPDGVQVSGTLNGSTGEIAVDGSGTYEVCAIAYDNAGNEGLESCEQITLSIIDTDVDGDGKPDFNDPDGDGCPDLNIKWQTSDGTWHIMNGDLDYNGIPELNIDSDGDGIADLNIDINQDGVADLNLAALTKDDWDPQICVVNDAVTYCTGTDAKPYLNIDTDGDGKADMNIDVDQDGKANLNTGFVPAWDCDLEVDFNQDGVVDYKTSSSLIGLQNRDTDGDLLPDLNVDLQLDHKPDLNICTDDSLKMPQLNIDGDGDGVADINIDQNNDGIADKNIVVITEWKPDLTVSGAFPYDTMRIEDNVLEDGDVVVENPDGNFSSNYTLKVEIVTDTISDAVKEMIYKQVEDNQEIQIVYDVILLKDNVRVQPESVLKIKIPVDETIQESKILIEQQDGSFKEIAISMEEGYYVFESDYLGRVSILGKHIDSSEEGVQQETTNHAQGGAATADETNVLLLFLNLGIAMFVFLFLFRNYQKDAS